MSTIPELKKAFLDSSIALSGAMLFEFNRKHPNEATEIEIAVNNGERLELAIEFREEGQEIRLSAVSDYDSRRLIATIPVPTKIGN